MYKNGFKRPETRVGYPMAGGKAKPRPNPMVGEVQAEMDTYICTYVSKQLVRTRMDFEN